MSVDHHVGSDSVTLTCYRVVLWLWLGTSFNAQCILARFESSTSESQHL